jgi:hypothetical protein
MIRVLNRLRHVRLHHLALLFLVVAARAGAQPRDPNAIRRPHMVVLLGTKDEASGRREANRAADRLGYGVAPDTFRKPGTRRIYVGNVITLQKPANDRFEVVSYLGDRADAMKALDQARRYYPDARMVPVELLKGATDEWIDMPFYRLGILVVGSYKTYEAALAAAQSFSLRSGYPYGSRGMVYDKQRGLIWPDDSDDEIWAGQYAPRRYDNECNISDPKSCITVERSEAYEGFKPGLYIVVAGVLRRDGERAQRLNVARKIVPEAYVKQTTIYLGCVH